MKKGSVMVLGAGGHARMVVAVLREMGHKNGICLDDDHLKWNPYLSFGSGLAAVVGPINQEKIKELARNGIRSFIVGIGSVNAGGCGLRHSFYLLGLAAGLSGISAISPTAVVMGDVAAGVFVGPGALVMQEAWIQYNVLINTGAIVEHHCFVGASSHIASGAILCGGVKVMAQVHVGAGAVVKQGVTIGDGATVGMGAVVLDDVAPGLTVVGNPARPLLTR